MLVQVERPMNAEIEVRRTEDARRGRRCPAGPSICAPTTTSRLDPIAVRRERCRSVAGGASHRRSTTGADSAGSAPRRRSPRIVDAADTRGEHAGGAGVEGGTDLVRRHVGRAHDAEAPPARAARNMLGNTSVPYSPCSRSRNTQSKPASPSVSTSSGDGVLTHVPSIVGPSPSRWRSGVIDERTSVRCRCNTEGHAGHVHRRRCSVLDRGGDRRRPAARRRRAGRRRLRPARESHRPRRSARSVPCR